MANNIVIASRVPEWDVIDTTKLKTFMTCPRRYFYEHVVGWRPEQPNHDLHYGISLHRALEYMYQQKKVTPTIGYSERDVIDGFAIFLQEYRKHFDEMSDQGVGHKNPENTLRALAQYIERYRDDAFQVVFTEISGSIAIGETAAGTERKMYFRLDTVCKGENGYFILEHKTSSWDQSKWALSWSFATQVGVGNHVMYCMHGDESAGMIVNGIFLRAQPRFKLNGEPYANSGPGNEFMRIPKKFTGAKMQDWMNMVNYNFDQIQQEMDILHSTDEGDSCMSAFPKRETGCFEYGRICPFHDFCGVWMNPTQRVHEAPVGLKVEHWDPTSLDTELTTKVDV